MWINYILMSFLFIKFQTSSLIFVTETQTNKRTGGRTDLGGLGGGVLGKREFSEIQSSQQVSIRKYGRTNGRTSPKQYAHPPPPPQLRRGGVKSMQ